MSYVGWINNPNVLIGCCQEEAGQFASMMTWSQFLYLVLTVVVAGLGAYFGAYLKEKGKNLATQEDIDRLVEQVSAVTEATKKIEAEISNEVWNRQRQWELKKDACINLMTRVSVAKDKLTALHIMYKTDRELGGEPTPERNSDKLSATREMNESLNRLDEVLFVALMVCEQKTQSALGNAVVNLRDLGTKITEEDEKSEEIFSELGNQIGVIGRLLRRELGLPSE